MKTARQKTPDSPRVVPSIHHARVRFALAVLTAASLFTACANTRPVTVSHPGMGLHIDLPPNFVDATPDILRRHQARQTPNNADISAEPVLGFDDDAGSRGCLISWLTTRDSALPGISTAPQMALAVSGMQGRHLALQSTPWPLMARGQSIGLGNDGSLPLRPLTQTVVSSRAAPLGPRAGWLVVTQQQWPASTGPIHGATRLATLVTEADGPQDGRRRWLMAQCAAAHLPDYVDGYLGELLDTVRDARWSGPKVAGAPLVNPPAPVSQ